MINGYASIPQGITYLLGHVTGGESLVTDQIPGSYEWLQNIIKLKKPVVGSFTYLDNDITSNFAIFAGHEPLSPGGLLALFYINASLISLNILITADDSVLINIKIVV